MVIGNVTKFFFPFPVIEGSYNTGGFWREECDNLLGDTG